MEYNRLLKQLSVSADIGRVRIVVEECRATGDVIILFGGGSYTLRAASGEIRGLLENILTSIDDNNLGIGSGGGE